MKILVIGSGFIAASIIQRLQWEGHNIMTYSRNFNKTISCEQFLGDIFDYKNFQRVFSWQPEVIVHTAWITEPERYKDDLSNYEYAKFAIELGNYAHSTGVEHLIILGSCAEYGSQNERSVAGKTKLAPTTLYAQQKVVAFNAIKEKLKTSSTRFTWARVFFPYGPNQNRKRLIPYLIDSLNDSKPILFYDSNSRSDWITTRDIATAISWVIHKKLPLEIDIGTSIGYTNLELLHCLREIMKISSKAPIHMHENLGLNEVAVASKDSPLLSSGWMPMDSLDSGLVWVLENE